jgi:transposase
VIQFLKQLLRYFPKGFILVWDRARIHTRHLPQDFLADHPHIHGELLPPYAPDLKPEEFCHGNIKQHLTNALPAHSSDVKRLLDNGFQRLCPRPVLLLACFQAPGLDGKQLLLL